MGSESLHESPEVLRPETVDLHRAIVSLMEELEAIDWYGQRADACTDADLREILLHNRKEEIEHAMMTLEWIRRKNADFDAHMKTYLFIEGSITGHEAEETGGGTEPAASSTSKGSLDVGSLRSAIQPKDKK